MTDLPLDQVRTLLAVVEYGTLDAAARALHVTPSAVSQRVKTLEQLTGRVLMQRTKPVRLTPSGEVVVRFARQLTRLEQDTLAELGMTDAGRPTRLPVAVNADSLASWFLPPLAAVHEERGVSVELYRADETTTTSLLREGRVMAAVTSSPDPVPGCSVRRLGRIRYHAMASPDFVARWLPEWPATPLRRTIAEVPVVVFDRTDDLQDRFVRRLTRGRGASGRRHLVPTSEGFVDAIAAGMGWGLVPVVPPPRHEPAADLVDLAADSPVDVPLFWQQWRLDSPALVALADAVTAAAAQALA